MKKLFLPGLLLLFTLTPGSVEAEPLDELKARQVQARAVQAAIWGMPAVNYDLMLQEMLSKTAGKVNQVIYWGRPLDWKNQTLTPNPDTLYFMSFFDTHEAGPIVVEIPPASANGSLNANFVNVWQAPLEDAGRFGIDKGKGIKFLILPPRYSGEVPNGYAPLSPGTFGSYALIRSNLRSHNEADVVKSAAYAKQVKVYPLSEASNPPSTVFTDVKDVVFDSTIRYDESFFRHLNRIVQSEPWLDRDRAMIDQLKSIGIEKGKPFSPDQQTEQALKDSIHDARMLLATRYDLGLPPFYDGTHWSYPAHPDLIKAGSEGFNDPDHYPIDLRGLTYTYAYIGIKHLGAGQFYLLNIKDKDGASYDGGKSYRLRVPTQVPVDEYWSLTAYDRRTHALIKNVTRASRASNNTDVQKNADGSIDIYIGGKAPSGQQTNWIPTDPTRQFELMFRLYGPKPEFFQKSWRLPDVERVEWAADGASSGEGNK